MAEGHSQKALQHRNELVFTAWHTAAFSRIDKLPSLESMIQKDHKQSQPQTDDEMMAMCRLLNAAFGGVEVDV